MKLFYKFYQLERLLITCNIKLLFIKLNTHLIYCNIKHKLTYHMNLPVQKGNKGQIYKFYFLLEQLKVYKIV